MAGGSIGGALATLTFSSSDNLAAATNVENTILAGINSGALTPVLYSGAANVVPSPVAGNGVAVFNTPTPQPVFVTAGNPYVIVNASGPVSIQGGAPGVTVLAGAGTPGAPLNLSFTNITPSGTALDNIVVTGGNNFIQTAPSGPGNYNVSTGSGNDTVNILSGNSTVNADTGFNQINLGTSDSLVNSVGFDAINGVASGGGTDTVNVTTGTTSVTSGSSNFIVNDTSPNPLLVNLGTGADLVNVANAGPATIQGAVTTTLAAGVGAVAGAEFATGDFVLLSGGSTSTVAAGIANDTVQALSGNNLIAAGTGNDTLLAGLGADTLIGGIGPNSNTALVSGTGLGTTFAFTPAQSGGSDTILGLKSTDLLTFSGYGPDPVGTATSVGTSTILTLSDGTKVTITGATPTVHQFATG